MRYPDSKIELTPARKVVSIYLITNEKYCRSGTKAKTMKTITKYTVAALLVSMTAQAAVYEFGFSALIEEGDTVTNEYAHAIGEDQFRMVADIANPTNGLATFSFYNLGPSSSILSTVQIDEGSGMGLQLNALVDNYVPGYVAGAADTVHFEIMGNVNKPPVNGADPAFDPEIGVRANGEIDLFTAGVLNGSDYGSAEKVTLELSYTPGLNILDMLTSGDLRIATKIQGVWYPGDDMSDPTTEISEYFMNDTGYTVIPEPSSAVLLLGASSLIGIVRRKFIR